MEVSGPPKLQKLINQLRFFYLSDWSRLFFFSQRCFCVRQLTVTHTNKSSYLDITSEHYFPRNSVRLTLNNKLCSNSTLKSMKHQDRTWHIHQTAFCSRLKYDVTAPQRSKSLTLQGPQGNGRISGFNRRKRAWQNRPAPIFSHWLPCIIMTSYRKSMIPLFLPVHSAQQWSVQIIQLGLSLATKNRTTAV